MYWPYVAMLVILVGFYALSVRNRRRQQEQQSELERRLTFGTEVMTTSGLYGTIVGRNDDDSVQLAIAPGVQVKWALAALRDVASLPHQYRRGIDDSMDGGADKSGSDPDDLRD